MKEEEFIERITDKFSILFYYTKINRRFENKLILEDYEWDKNTKDFAYKEKKFTELEIVHCATLWLIDELIKRENVCFQKKLHSLIAWKFSTNKNTPTKIINRLLAIKYVEKGKSKKDGRGNIVKLTPLGKDFIENNLKETRKANIKKLFSLLQSDESADESNEIFKLDESNYMDVIILFHKLSERAWNKMLKEGKEKDNCHS